MDRAQLELRLQPLQRARLRTHLMRLVEFIGAELTSELLNEPALEPEPDGAQLELSLLAPQSVETLFEALVQRLFAVVLVQRLGRSPELSVRDPQGDDLAREWETVCRRAPAEPEDARSQTLRTLSHVAEALLALQPVARGETRALIGRLLAQVAERVSEVHRAAHQRPLAENEWTATAAVIACVPDTSGENVWDALLGRAAGPPCLIRALETRSLDDRCTLALIRQMGRRPDVEWIDAWVAACAGFQTVSPEVVQTVALALAAHGRVEEAGVWSAEGRRLWPTLSAWDNIDERLF